KRAARLAIAALAIAACSSEQVPRDMPIVAEVDEEARSLGEVPDPAIEPGEPGVTLADLDNAEFRDRVVALVREVAAGGATATCALPPLASPVWAVVRIYHEGASLGRGSFVGADLCPALKEATRRAIAAAGPARKFVPQARFVVELPDRGYSLVEYEGRGLELIHGVVPTRVLDRSLV